MKHYCIQYFIKIYIFLPSSYIICKMLSIWSILLLFSATYLFFSRLCSNAVSVMLHFINSNVLGHILIYVIHCPDEDQRFQRKWHAKIQPRQQSTLKKQEFLWLSFYMYSFNVSYMSNLIKRLCNPLQHNTNFE